MRYLLLILSFSTLCATAFCQDKILADLQNNVSEKALKEIVYFLASDKCQGRMATTNGDFIAANYVEGIMKKQGLLPSGVEGYRQQVPLTPMIDNYSDLTIDGKTYAHNYTWGNANFDKRAQSRPRFHAKSIAFKNVPIVFANHGVGDSLYSNYSNIDVSGKVVIAVNGLPNFLKGKIVTTGDGNNHYKIKWLIKKGAVCYWLYYPQIQGVLNEQYGKRMDTLDARMLCQLTNTLPPKETDLMPVMFISKQIVEDVLGDRKGALDSLMNNFDSTRIYQGIETGKTMSLSYNLDTSNHLNSPNIMGMIKGSDPNAGYIVFSAHRDHEGQAFGKTYYGADDDASGTAMMLECAKGIAELSKKGIRPKKSILFLSTTAEEHGKLGAKYFLDNPTIPLAQMKYNINTDMVGRIDSFHTKKNDTKPYIYPVYYDTLYDFGTTITTINKNFPEFILDDHYLKEKPVSNKMNRTDGAEFAAKKIPSLCFFSGYHPDYHTPNDTPDKIDYALLKKRTEFVLLTLWTLANE